MDRDKELKKRAEELAKVQFTPSLEERLGAVLACVILLILGIFIGIDVTNKEIPRIILMLLGAAWGALAGILIRILYLTGKRDAWREVQEISRRATVRAVNKEIADYQQKKDKSEQVTRGGCHA